ncbi:MAG: LCP family protein [Actinomycetota bacterium]|nr:LCP family protein [Actinomycetota bacterium]MDK1097542.1 LCP family protein [Actinomycetota bacterium]MDK1104308.1 LCP family protein [Actinomycetota bacterium]
MRVPHRLLTAAIVSALVATACSPATSTEVTTTVLSTTTTLSTTTSTGQHRPTTTAPLAVVRMGGELPSEVAKVVAGFLSVVQDPRNDAEPLDPDLVAHHAGIEGRLGEVYTATARTQELETGGSVGVVTLDNDDIVLLADEGDGWQVVGAHLRSVGVDPWFGESPRRVLVLGSDARPGFAAAVHRMDSIHVLTSVPAVGGGTILGWPRDTWVETAYGEMRINALTASSRGPDALFAHFTEEFEIPLDGYILTAFSGFEKLIAAAVGRLLINLPTRVPVQPWWPAFSAGEQRLTPTRTLDFARTRKQLPGGDFTRSWHHGLIMLATLTMLQQGSVEDVPMLLGELVKYTETNLTPTDLVQLGAAAFYMDVGDITNEVLPGQLGRAANGASVVFLDPEAEDIIRDVIEDGLRNSG